MQMSWGRNKPGPVWLEQWAGWEVRTDGQVRSLSLLYVQQVLCTERLNPHTAQS